MITYNEARRLVAERLAQDEAKTTEIAESRKDLSPREREILGLGPPEDDVLELVVQDEHTIEGDFGWVFFYQSKSFLDTEDTSHALAGNAPLLVSRTDGSVHITGTAQPTEFYIENFKRSGDPHREGNSQ